MQEQLAGLLDRDTIIPPEQLDRYAVDGLVPQAVVQPSSRRAVADILRWASSESVSVFPQGGGTQTMLGNVPVRVDLVLDLSRHARLLDYQPADLTVTVDGGIALSALQRELAEGGKFLPLEAPLAEKATVGGILATGATGPRRSAYGPPRDWLIGIGVVSAGGVETRAGGKVVKNVTGYDLNKLYTGSLGTLGVIVEATFTLSPLPTDSGTLVAVFPSLEEGIRAGGDLLRQVYAPLGVQVIDGAAAHRLNAEQGIASIEGIEEHWAVALAFFSGRPRAVTRRLNEGTRFLREAGATDIAGLDREEGNTVLRRLTDLGWSEETQPYLGIRVSVPPSAVARVAGGCCHDAPPGLAPAVVADPGCGAVRLLWWAGPAGDGPDESLGFSAIGRVRDLVRQAGGTMAVEHCPLPLKKQIDVWGDAPPGMEIMRRIKQKFDPSGILNPGRFAGRI